MDLCDSCHVAPQTDRGAGSFLGAYRKNLARGDDAALEADIVAESTKKLTLDWSGTASELLQELGRTVDETTRKQKFWPKTPQAIGIRLKKLAQIAGHSESIDDAYHHVATDDLLQASTRVEKCLSDYREEGEILPWSGDDGGSKQADEPFVLCVQDQPATAVEVSPASHSVVIFRAPRFPPGERSAKRERCKNRRWRPRGRRRLEGSPFPGCVLRATGIGIEKDGRSLPEDMKPRIARYFAAALSAITWAGTLGAQEAQDGDSKEALIEQAGNADGESVRLALLERLRKRSGLEGSLAADADRLIAEIRRWIHSERLDYFGGQVARTRDFDFKIERASPLYPLTYLYRGRMVVWYAMESGSVWNVPAQRRRFLDRARELFERAAEAFPENRIAGMYLGRPTPPRKLYPSVPGAPEWAAYQREGLERLADIIEWWIDNRMRENGEYGGGWGDDCEMWRWWVPVLIGFDSPKIGRAQARFSRALLSRPHMKLGYTSRMTDVEHTAEDSADAMTPMMHLDPDDDAWQGKALRLADLMETLWTGKNERGFLQFKSTYFTAERVDETPRRACDTVYHPRAVQPALLYWQRTGDERLRRLFSAWMDTWVDAAMRSERGKPAGIVPTAIHWPDGSVGGLGADWWDPRNHGEHTLYLYPSAMSLMTHTLLLTFHMTGESKYMDPIRSMARIRLEYLSSPPAAPPAPGTEGWCASKLGGLSGVVAKYRLLEGNAELDALLAREASPYMGFRMNGDRRRMTRALRDTAEALRINFEGYSSEVRYTDRVLRLPSLFGENGMFREAIATIRRPDTSLLYSSVTGDPGDAGYFPLNAVRWLTPPRDIAALVIESGKERLTAELFHFGADPRAMSAELYLLSEGDYALELSSVARGKDVPVARDSLAVKGPRTRVSFELPPRTLCVLRVRRS